MNEGSGRSGDFKIFLAVFMTLLIFSGGLATGWLLRSQPSGPVVVTPTLQAEANPLLEAARLQATRQVQPVSQPTMTPQPAAEPPTATPEAAPTVVSTDPMPTFGEGDASGYVRFRVQADTLPLHQGPGSDYPVLGQVSQGAELLVAGRTPDGVWWLVCCYEGQSGWVILQAGNALVLGDANSVEILEFPAEGP